MVKGILCFKTTKKVKILGGGSVLDILMFVTAICKAVIEKVEKEKNMDYEEAMKFVISSINEGINKLED